MLAERRALLSKLVANGDDSLRASRPGDALDIFNAALQSSPDDFALLHRRGLALTALDIYDHALQSFDRALSIGSSPREVGYLRAVRSDCLRRWGRDDEALADSKIAISICPDDICGYLAKARAILNVNLSAAVEAYDDIIARGAELLAGEPPEVEQEVKAERERLLKLLLAQELQAVHLRDDAGGVESAASRLRHRRVADGEAGADDEHRNCQAHERVLDLVVHTAPVLVR